MLQHKKGRFSLRHCFCCTFEHGHTKAGNEYRELRETQRRPRHRKRWEGARLVTFMCSPRDLQNFSLGAVDPKKRATGNASADTSGDADRHTTMKRLADLSRDLSYLALT